MAIDKGLKKFTKNYLQSLSIGLEGLDVGSIQTAIGVIEQSMAEGGTVWLMGNGGSAALAAHMAVDLQLGGIRAIALTDAVALSSYANDEGFDNALAIQLNLLTKASDVGIFISTSGESENIICAATEFPGRVLTITGHRYCKLNGCGRVNASIITHAPSTPLIQDLQQTVLHIISYWLIAKKGKR